MAALPKPTSSDRPPAHFVTLANVMQMLREQGINPTVGDIADQLERFASFDSQISIVDVLEREPGSILAKALTGSLAVPDFKSFTRTILRIFEDVKRDVSGGACASYIPALASADPSLFAVSVCTVDGQQFSCGDAAATFSFQSCVKPLVYAVAVEDRGLSLVHRHVGFEPSGLAFNEVSLNPAGLPHNPMVNAGAISTGALVGPGLHNAAKFRYFQKKLEAMAGGRKISFSHETYLGEHETAWRNNALVAFMTDAGVFPRSVDPTTALDFYLQACSIEIDTAVGANVAATLAAGGVSPLTGERCLSAVTTKATLTLMFSCGMYDYSGEWMSTVDLPAKSGVSGIIYVVIPHIMGIAVFSPPLDSHGNSVRGVEFCKRLLREYNFGVFDQIVSGSEGAAQSRATGCPAVAVPRPLALAVPVPLPTSTSRGVRFFPPSHNIVSHVSSPLAASQAPADSSTAIATSWSSDPPTKSSLGSGQTPVLGPRVAASVVGDGSSVLGGIGRITTASGQRLEKIRRVGHSIRRLSRAWMLLRAWSGLPVAAGDLATLQACAAADEDAPAELLPSVSPGGARKLVPLSVSPPVAPQLAASGLTRSVSDTFSGLAQPRTSRSYCAVHEAEAVDSPELHPDDSPFPAIYERYKRYRMAVAASLADGDSSLLFATGLSGVSDSPVLVDAMRVELNPGQRLIPLVALRLFLERSGLSVTKENPACSAQWDRILASNARILGGGGKRGIHLGAIIGSGALPEAATATRPVPASTSPFRGGVIVKALLGKLAMSIFPAFVADLHAMLMNTLRSETGGEVPKAVAIDEILGADPDHFGVSVCTVDGQIANLGDEGADALFPLMAAVRPLLYGLACKDVGVAEVHRWVGGEPTAADPMAFTLLQPGNAEGHGGGGRTAKPMGPPPLPPSDRMPPGAIFVEPERPPHPRPFNPFVEAGALTLCALAGRAHYPPEGRLFHDNGSRFSHMMGGLTSVCGGRRIGFNNSVFLAEKQKRLTSIAISFYCKGMGVYPDVTDPTQTAHMLFQAEAVETDTENLAVMAATLANIGTCPLTQERCFEPHVTRSVLSLMYNSGLNRFSGNWAFKVGIPAASGSSGATFLVIPGVMGIGIYSPRLNTLGVSPRAIKLCQLLTARYRVNIFDRLVYADADVAVTVSEPQRLRAIPGLALQLCTAAGSGDLVTIHELLAEGADPNVADYDLRTPLHVACSDGHLEVVRVLLEAGANVRVRDRWGSTPYDDAVRHRAVVELIDEHEHMATGGLPRQRKAASIKAPASILRPPAPPNLSATGAGDGTALSGPGTAHRASRGAGSRSTERRVAAIKDPSAGKLSRDSSTRAAAADDFTFAAPSF